MSVLLIFQLNVSVFHSCMHHFVVFLLKDFGNYQTRCLCKNGYAIKNQIFCLYCKTQGFQWGRHAIAFELAGTRPKLSLRAISRAPGDKYFS